MYGAGGMGDKSRLLLGRERWGGGSSGWGAEPGEGV